jgi:hypothetical protein
MVVAAADIADVESARSANRTSADQVFVEGVRYPLAVRTARPLDDSMVRRMTPPGRDD